MKRKVKLPIKSFDVEVFKSQRGGVYVEGVDIKNVLAALKSGKDLDGRTGQSLGPKSN